MSLRLRHILLVVCFVSGCSVYMEATRPTPVDLGKFHPGDSRSSVTQELGSPVTTSKGAGGTTCDLYLLYTKGYGVAGKAPILGRPTHRDRPFLRRHQLLPLQRIEVLPNGHGRQTQPLRQLCGVQRTLGLEQFDDRAASLGLAGLKGCTSHCTIYK